MLPEIKKVKLQALTLPTAWQTLIFRCYGYVKTENIARVLGCDTDTVRREAERLGIEELPYAEDFMRRGYITLIRSCWQLLPYGQLMSLLDFDEERLAFVLEKDDFLDVKLGRFKPECDEVRYSPITETQAKETEILYGRIAELSRGERVAPFDFFKGEKVAPPSEIRHNGHRIVHGYLSPCGDVFATDCADTLPDELLMLYKNSGVDGIWLHALLSSLSPYPFAPRLSEGYEQRRANLNKIIKRCAKYGISLYLYMNEPRALPTDALPKYEQLIGWREKRTLCLENAEVREYLYGAVRGLCEAASGLGGIFTITMSENPTHCNYLKETGCPVCKGIAPEESAALVNNIIYKAMRDSGTDAELIANLWGWSPFMGWSEEQTYRGVELLDKGISVLCVSEYDLEIEKVGVKSRVIDYSISNPGPSEITKTTFKKARECGHKIYAKIQASNSWECSAVPYIPVFDLIYEHLCRLDDEGARDHFLTWTLGGYPSPSVELAARFEHGFDLEAWYKEKFGKSAERVHEGVRLLCNAFREYPFSLSALYYSPKNIGPANLWDISDEENTSSMVCYSFDDVETWTSPYPNEVYVSQLERLIAGWESGIRVLESVPQTAAIGELCRYARVAYCHFYTDLLQTRFALYKRVSDKAGMAECVKAEAKNAAVLLKELRADAKVGFEASNHYVYTERNLIEKIIRMESFEKCLREVISV